MSWDLDHLRKIAGLNESFGSHQLNEAWDDDYEDDDDPDVKRAEKQLARQKTRLPKVKVDAEKDLTKISGSKKSAEQEAKEEEKEKEESAKKAVEKKKEADEAPKADDHEEKESPAKEKAEHKEQAPSKSEEKKETAAEEKAEEKKRRGKAPSDSSKRQRLIAHMKANPSESRANLIAWAEKNLGMGDNYASQQIQAVRAAAKKQLTSECFVLRHPSVPNFVLHENGAMKMYQWISVDDERRDPLVLATEAEAKQVAKYLLEYKNQLVDIEHIELD